MRDDNPNDPWGVVLVLAIIGLLVAACFGAFDGEQRVRSYSRRAKVHREPLTAEVAGEVAGKTTHDFGKGFIRGFRDKKAEP